LPYHRLSWRSRAFTSQESQMDYANFRNSTALTDEQIRARAPSVFATEAHSSRSQRYTYVDTARLLAGLRQEGFMPVSAVQSRCRSADKQPFTKHLIRFMRGEINVDAVDVDDIIPQVCLKNSHDGSSAYELSLGGFRVRCKNGLMVSEGTFEEIKVPHKGDVIGRIIEGAFEVIGAAEKVQDHVKDWRALTLQPTEQVAFARSALMLRFDGDENKVTAGQILEPKRYEDRGADLWSTFNRVQENVIRGGQRYVNPSYRDDAGRYHRARRMHTREVTGIDQNTNLNRALWALAESMAQIKKGQPSALGQLLNG